MGTRGMNRRCPEQHSGAGVQLAPCPVLVVREHPSRDRYRPHRQAEQQLNQHLNKVDLVIEVRDARIPMATGRPHLLDQGQAAPACD